MLNYLWGGMIVISVIYGIFTGNIAAVSQAAIDSSKEAVELCIIMAGVVSMWMGFMEVASSAGVLEGVRRLLKPVVRFLFPNIPKDHDAEKYIADSFAANILGLGWAATPAGLKAMKALLELEEEKNSTNAKKLNKDGKSIKRTVTNASNEMCTFLVMNISSLQLIPVNMIAYRSKYGSVNPASITGPAIAATFFSTFVAVIICKIMSKCSKKG